MFNFSQVSFLLYFSSKEGYDSSKFVFLFRHKESISSGQVHEVRSPKGPLSSYVTEAVGYLRAPKFSFPTCKMGTIIL
jgi:hypothetical protein